jgi:hypothetical protein
MTPLQKRRRPQREQGADVGSAFTDRMIPDEERHWSFIRSIAGERLAAESVICAAMLYAPDLIQSFLPNLRPSAISSPVMHRVARAAGAEIVAGVRPYRAAAWARLDEAYISRPRIALDRRIIECVSGLLTEGVIRRALAELGVSS